MSDKVKKEIFNSVNENVQALAKLFPSVVKDGEVDFDALKEELGEFVEVGAEKYDFTWAGKSKAKAEARDSGEGLTLKLKVGEGVNEDTTQNIYIEGDNLKALKLLRNSYYGAIKMIYIDPPYNTGKDFVYRDDYTLTQEELDVLEGNIDAYGFRLCRNNKDSAKYHTDWLNNLFARLLVSRDLLSPDGVVFISIDDNEYANLKKLCDMVFNESNYVGTIIHQRAKGGGQAKYLVKGHDYILVYGKSIEKLSLTRKKVVQKKTIVIDGEEYMVNDDVIRKTFGKYDKSLGDRRCFYEELIQYKGEEKKREIDEQLEKGELFLKDNGDGTHTICRYEKVADATSKLYSIIKVLSEEGKAELDSLGIKGFDYPKPVDIVRQLVEAGANQPDSIVLDFYSGSATTAQAVMAQNSIDGGNRLCIMVQLAEDLDVNYENASSDEKKMIQSAIDFCDSIKKPHYITEIGKERIRRAGKKIIEENPDKKSALDIGFKVFEVAETNIRMFSEEMKGNDLFDLVKETDKELRDFMPDTKDIDVCYELLLRHRGVALSSSIEKLDIGERTYIIADSIVVCLDSEVTEEMVAKLAVIDPQPMKYIFRDSAFGDDISLKENTMIMLSALIEKTTGDSKKAYKVEFI